MGRIVYRGWAKQVGTGIGSTPLGTRADALCAVPAHTNRCYLEPVDPLPAPLADARCAHHPDSPAVFVCRRCGAFGCESCRADPAAGQCQACVRRAQAALGAPITVGETLGRSFRLPFEHLREVLLYLALALLPELLWALSMEWLIPGPRGSDGLLDAFFKGRAHDLTAVRQLLVDFSPRLAATAAVKFVAFVTGLAGAGALAVTFIAAVEGRAVSLRSTYGLSTRRLLPLLLVNAMTRAVGLVGLLLCVLPGMAFMGLCLFTDPLVLLARRGPFSAISTSIRMSMKVLGPLAVLILLTNVVAGGLSAPVGLLHGLTRGAPLADHLLDFCGTAAEQLLAVPLIAASAYLYVRLEAWRTLLTRETTAASAVPSPGEPTGT